MVYLKDLFPTLAEYAGAKIPDGVEAQSLVPIIRGQVSKVRDVLYTGYKEVQRSVRDDRWKLIRYPHINRTQLFDLQNDPHELNDLTGNPTYAAQATRMMTLLKQEQEKYGDSAPLTVADPKPETWTPPAPVAKPAN